jgi:hypothetical protein
MHVCNVRVRRKKNALRCAPLFSALYKPLGYMGLERGETSVSAAGGNRQSRIGNVQRIPLEVHKMRALYSYVVLAASISASSPCSSLE